MNRGATAILALVAALFTGNGSVWAGEQVPAKQFIVPGVGIGDFKLGMSKDEVLKKAGKPGTIYSGDREYTLENLPRLYWLEYDNIELKINNNAVQEIRVCTPLYKFANGLGKGVSEEKIKQAFGGDFRLDRYEAMGTEVLTYEGEGVKFSVHEQDRTVGAIWVIRPRGGHRVRETQAGSNAKRSHYPLPGPIVLPKIDREPPIAHDNQPERMDRLPKYDHKLIDPYQVDLRDCDLSKLDLRHSVDDLLLLCWINL
jgi:hypothetical protein